ncbi:hypothetical protein NMD1_01194 [Novosphingobium sp. MD-1]|nr:hypothetical protein NMD1_01194 [Novosphingobium sp. MD-1]
MMETRLDHGWGQCAKQCCTATRNAAVTGKNRGLSVLRT